MIKAFYLLTILAKKTHFGRIQNTPLLIVMITSDIKTSSQYTLVRLNLVFGIILIFCFNHGLLNTRPYMSHLKAKIKRPVFQKNSTKWEDRELYNVLLGFVYPAIVLPKRQFQITFRTKFKKICYEKYQNETTCCFI